jgi:ribonuclease E
MKRMLVNATQPEELRVAIVDGQKLDNLDIENKTREQKKSNIYKAKITRVEPSLEAAFVDYGAERHGFLPFKEIAKEFLGEAAMKDGGGRPNVKAGISEGQEILVQIEKEERGNKGAALTTFISLAGRFLVLMPNNPRAGGVSRRIEGDDRSELKAAMNELEIADGMGIIVRTAGVGRTADELQWDLDYQAKTWEAICDAGAKAKAPSLIYQESNVIVRALRDYFRGDIGEILIDEPAVYEQAQTFISQYMPHNLRKLKLYQEDVPLFSRYQIEGQIESAYQREVRLPSGGAIVIDHTEALISIDINSARATKGSDIEETATNTNIEACDEIGRQLRLRDLGGLVVVDFIDMMTPKNQRMVENRLRDVAKLDRARVQIGRISRFGLMEMSRQRLRPSLGETTEIVCPRCVGQGTIRTVESLALQLLRLLEEETLKENTGRVLIKMPVAVATYLLNEKRDAVREIEERNNAQALLVPDTNLVTPHYEIERIRSSETDHDAVQLNSHELATKKVTSYTPTADKVQIAESETAAVQTVAPPSPIPPPAAKADTTAVAERGGFFSRIFGFLAGQEKTEEQEEKRSTRGRNNRNAKQDGKRDGRRQGNDQNRRNGRNQKDSQNRRNTRSDNKRSGQSEQNQKSADGRQRNNRQDSRRGRSQQGQNHNQQGNQQNGQQSNQQGQSQNQQPAKQNNATDNKIAATDQTTDKAQDNNRQARGKQGNAQGRSRNPRNRNQRNRRQTETENQAGNNTAETAAGAAEHSAHGQSDHDNSFNSSPSKPSSRDIASAVEAANDLQARSKASTDITSSVNTDTPSQKAPDTTFANKPAAAQQSDSANRTSDSAGNQANATRNSRQRNSSDRNQPVRNSDAGAQSESQSAVAQQSSGDTSSRGTGYRDTGSRDTSSRDTGSGDTSSRDTGSGSSSASSTRSDSTQNGNAAAASSTSASAPSTSTEQTGANADAVQATGTSSSAADATSGTAPQPAPASSPAQSDAQAATQEGAAPDADNSQADDRKEQNRQGRREGGRGNRGPRSRYSRRRRKPGNDAKSADAQDSSASPEVAGGAVSAGRNDDASNRVSSDTSSGVSSTNANSTSGAAASRNDTAVSGNNQRDDSNRSAGDANAQNGNNRNTSRRSSENREQNGKASTPATAGNGTHGRATTGSDTGSSDAKRSQTGGSANTNASDNTAQSSRSTASEAATGSSTGTATGTSTPGGSSTPSGSSAVASSSTSKSVTEKSTPAADNSQNEKPAQASTNRESNGSTKQPTPRHVAPRSDSGSGRKSTLQQVETSAKSEAPVSPPSQVSTKQPSQLKSSVRSLASKDADNRQDSAGKTEKPAAETVKMQKIETKGSELSN